MAVCATNNTNNDLILDTANTVPCPDYTVLEDVEYQRLIETPTLQEIFTMPIAADLGQIWLVGFSLPMIIYLSAWALGSVVNFINSK